jgi:O-antigen/teichoic acid export membrane protein
MSVAPHIARLARHSALYGVGDFVARFLGIFLLPLYTAYLTPADYGQIEILVAGSAVLLVVLRRGVSEGFFRFYFDAADAARRTTVVRTTFWFTMASATVALVLGLVFAEPLGRLLQLGDEADLVRAAVLGLWAQLNFSQLMVVYRAEERAVAFSIATLATVVVTIAATVLLVVVLDGGALGALVGSFAGTLVVYCGLLFTRRADLGLEFNRPLLRAMNRFGAPLVPAALALWAIGFADRWFIAVLKDQTEVGVYSVAVRVASAVFFLQLAFRRAWSALAYSITDDTEARRTYSYVLTYVVYITCWAALGLTLLAPWVVDLLTSDASFDRASDAVGPLAFSAVGYAAFTVLSIGSGRSWRTQGNWVVAGIGATLNVGLCLLLIPHYGMIGAAVSTLASYATLAVGMYVYAQRVYAVAYQLRRVSTLVLVSAGIASLGVAFDLPLAAALPLALAFPVLLVPLGFYLPGEVRRARRFVPTMR